MKEADDFSTYHEELLDGQYDCVDRIVLNGYFPLGQQGGGFRTWWRLLTGSDATLDREHRQRLAGRFSRRLHAYAQAHHIPVIHCAPGTRKHEVAEKYLPPDPTFEGLCLILVAKAPALVWEVTKTTTGAPHLARKQPWPYVNHYHFHLIDKDWGHITIKISGHPPFGVQLMLNGHEWVDRQAHAHAIAVEKEGNCFVGGSFQALDQLAETLREPHAIGRLTEVCDRWIYSSCLCFALDLEEQARSRFRYRYSCYQLEYSRTLVCRRGTTLDQVYQGLIDRTRALLDVPKLKTVFGWKQRPHKRRRDGARLERVLDASAYDLTVFQGHVGPLTLKLYDKGARGLRVEAIAHNVRARRGGRSVENLSIMLATLQRRAIDFLNVVHAAHSSFFDDGALDTLSEPTHRGTRRLAGVDLQKPRMRRVSAAVVALAAQPGGFTTEELAAKTRALWADRPGPYTARHAAYDLAKLRGKALVERVAKTRRYRVHPVGSRTLAGLLILREKVIKPVLAGARRFHQGRSPKTIHPLDLHYLTLQRELHRTFQTLALAA